MKTRYVALGAFLFLIFIIPLFLFSTIKNGVFLSMDSLGFDATDIYLGDTTITSGIINEGTVTYTDPDSSVIEYTIQDGTVIDADGNIIDYINQEGSIIENIEETTASVDEIIDETLNNFIDEETLNENSELEWNTATETTATDTTEDLGIDDLFSGNIVEEIEENIPIDIPEYNINDYTVDENGNITENSDSEQTATIAERINEVDYTTTNNTATVNVSESIETIDMRNADDLVMTFTTKTGAIINRDQNICFTLNQIVQRTNCEIGTNPIINKIPFKKSVNEYCIPIKISTLDSRKYQVTCYASNGIQRVSQSINILIQNGENTTETGIKTAVQIAEERILLIQEKCQLLGINDLEECRKTLAERYAIATQAENMTQEEIKKYISENLEEIVNTQTKNEEINVRSSLIINQSLRTQEIEKTLNENNGYESITLPIREKDVQLMALQSKEEIRIDNGQILQTTSIVTIIDNDGDGLSNEIEKRLGTDPEKADTDGDGYNDREEIANGYNPLGEGKLETEISPIEKAIINKKIIEQAKTSGELEVDFFIKKVQNATSGEGYTLSGQCEPNSMATLYIYSDIPVITTVATDEYGNWEYEFTDPLEDGEHEIYVAINDDTGKVIKKSNPLNFIVQEAQAFSASELTDIKMPLQTEEKKSDDMMMYYIIFAGSIILVGIFLFAFLLLNKKKVSI